MPPVEFKPMISAGEQPQTLDRAAFSLFNLGFLQFDTFQDVCQLLHICMTQFSPQWMDFDEILYVMPKLK